MEKAASEDAIERGETFDWTITVTNDGPEDILTPVTIEDPLPEDVRFIELSAPDEADCEVVDGVISCEVDGLADGESVEIVVTTEALAEGDIANTVSVLAAHVAGVNSTVSAEATQQVLPPNTFGLAFTGAEMMRLVTVAGLALVAGFGLLLAGKRRKAIS